MHQSKTLLSRTGREPQEETPSLAAGFIYLLHWQDRHGRVEHYVGWTTDLPARLKAHYSNSGGCPTTRNYRRARMGGRLVRLWTGTKRGEKKLQQTLDFPNDCPYCCGEEIGNIPCEGWVEAEEAPLAPLKSCNPSQT